MCVIGKKLVMREKLISNKDTKYLNLFILFYLGQVRRRLG